MFEEAQINIDFTIYRNWLLLFTVMERTGGRFTNLFLAVPGHSAVKGKDGFNKLKFVLQNI